MDNRKLIEKYREQLILVHLATVLIVSFVEIMAYVVFVKCGIHSFSLKCEYLWLNVTIPILINLLAHLAVRLINSHEKASDNLKDSSVIYGAFVTTFVVSLFHRDYIVTLCAFVFPIILSAMYNNKRLLKQSLWLSLFSLTTTMFVLLFEHKLNLTTSLNIVILYGYIAVSFLSGIISIKFSQRNFSVIEQQLIDNSDLASRVILDQMTGLYNHKAFYEKLQASMVDVNENKGNCCVAIIDVDNFKKVNDTYGHDAGDQVLVFLAKVLREYCDMNDYPCRYGGEEFAVIFHGKSLEESKIQMKKVLKRFNEHIFEFSNSNVTFSCGIAQMGMNDTIEQFFCRADSCLYYSKRNGKNCITTEERI